MPPGGAVYLGQKSIFRQLVLAANLQTNWNAPVASAAYTEAVHFDVSGFSKLQRMKESTYGEAGSGNSFASNSFTIGQKTSLDFSGKLTEWLAGWLFGLSMGKEVVVGGAPPYVHTFNFLDASTVAQATSLYMRDTSAIAYQLVDMGITQLTITSTANGALKFKASMIGSGVIVDGALGGMPVPRVAPQYFYGSDAIVSVGPNGGAVNSIYPRCKSWELTIDTGVAEMRVPGSGLYAAYLTVDMPKVKWKMVVDATNVDDFRGWQKNDTVLTINTVVTSGAAVLSINLPNVVLADNDLGDQNGNAAWTISLDEQSILQIGAIPLLTVGVTNGIPSYLTAA